MIRRAIAAAQYPLGRDAGPKPATAGRACSGLVQAESSTLPMKPPCHGGVVSEFSREFLMVFSLYGYFYGLPFEHRWQARRGATRNRSEFFIGQ